MNICEEFHTWLHTLPKLHFPLDKIDVPTNGIYLLFEKGERAHCGARIVRVGTHTGEGQLYSRLKQHFILQNKDRSIFRKNIGRALLARDNDPFLADWELDLTSVSARTHHVHRINVKKQKLVEDSVSEYIRTNFSFSVISIDDKKERLYLESRIISTVSFCPICKPSTNWLGNFSPKKKIRESGLWIVNELYKEPLQKKDFTRLKSAML